MYENFQYDGKKGSALCKCGRPQGQKNTYSPKTLHNYLQNSPIFHGILLFFGDLINNWSVTSIMGIIFWNFILEKLGFNTSKAMVDICYKNIVYKLPNELPNDLRLRIWEYYEVLEKCQNWAEIEPSAQFSFYINKTFVIAVKTYAEVVTKIFFSCPIFLDFFTLSQIFYPGLLFSLPMRM